MTAAPFKRQVAGGLSGLRVRAPRGHPATRKAILRFAGWLRSNYDFPVRVHVCLIPGPKFVTQDGESAVASLWYPYTRKRQARIRIATGDYPGLKAQRGRDDALAALLYSFARQVIRYQQWVETGKLPEKSVGRRAGAMLRRYSATMEHP